MQQQKRSKYQAENDNTDSYCCNCYYYREGLCTKDEALIAISDPNSEYCEDFSYDFIAENLTNKKRSV